MMTSNELKADLAKVFDDARRLTNTYTGVSMVIRCVPEQTIRDLASTADGHGIEEMAQRLRVELGALDRALALVIEEVIIRAREIRCAQDAAANVKAAGNTLN